MQNTELQLIQPSLDLTICVDADTCASELKRCADEADRCAALAQAGAELAIRHAWNAGAVCNKAKEIIPHGEFTAWLEINRGERSLWTMQKWMKMAKTNLDWILENPQVKTMTDAYIATGVLPEPEPKADTGEGEKEKPPFVLNFKTDYKHVSEWSRDAARDFLYEFDRIARTAMQLKTEFGL
jgi:hypothetical protein